MLYEAFAVGCVIGFAFGGVILGYMQERKIRKQRALIKELEAFIEETLARYEEAVQAVENMEKPLIVYVKGPNKDVQN